MEKWRRLETYALDGENRRAYQARAEGWERIADSLEMDRRRIGSQGQEIIDKATYNRLTKEFVKKKGIIIRGETAQKHLANRAYAAYLPGFDVAFILDEATVSDVLEEMYHAKQDRTKMFGAEFTEEVRLRREIDAQKY